MVINQIIYISFYSGIRLAVHDTTCISPKNEFINTYGISAHGSISIEGNSPCEADNHITRYIRLWSY